MGRKRVETDEKLRLLDAYIAKPRGVNDPQILRAIKNDVEKANKAKPKPQADNTLYNLCMGAYREFLAAKGTHLDMTGRKAVDNSNAMRGIIEFIRDFQKAKGKPHGDGDVYNGWGLILNSWDSLNDYHRRRVSLPSIRQGIEEIIATIRNGDTKKAGNKASLDRKKAEILDRFNRGPGFNGHH